MKMKIWLAGVSILGLIAVAGIYIALQGKETINHHYVFTGSGEYWSAEYEVTATETFQEKNNKTEYSSNPSGHFKLLYNRELAELSGLYKITYSYKGTANGGSGTEEFSAPPKSKEVISRSAGGGNGAFERKDSKIEVTVEWQGKTETFYLLNKQ
ncbi:hypothetical protein [Paenibacillus mesotrionivorans]|uniref:Uncharacterized protein n=1 Tax=Paenibacillus mesotrionivorans TaxID=3160968 RepID=A0ACC7NX04_9BACL